MPENPKLALTEHRAQAELNVRYAWGILAALAAGWLLLIFSAPFAAYSGFKGFASTVYYLFGFICHQRPDRSYFIFGHELAVCSRCIGIYFGVFLGLIFYPIWRPMNEPKGLPRIGLFLAMLPIGFDWLLGVTGIWQNTFFSRTLTGLILGAACATYIMPAIVEIVLNKSFGLNKRVAD
ncbi:MAG TPA: DUF2085 domain-containing protein [Pyrinomonadaceae bacterium]|nr:DUF2085 domain-containing protein [Pyrinomonadaceae bacterium]